MTALQNSLASSHLTMKMRPSVNIWLLSDIKTDQTNILGQLLDISVLSVLICDFQLLDMFKWCASISIALLMLLEKYGYVYFSKPRATKTISKIHSNRPGDAKIYIFARRRTIIGWQPEMMCMQDYHILLICNFTFLHHVWPVKRYTKLFVI